MLCTSVVAQTKKSVKYYGAAMKYKAAKNNDKACQRMERSIARAPQFPESYSELGEWYFQAHKFAQAAQVFKNASDRCKEGHERFAKPYALSLLYSGDADKALSIINTYGYVKVDAAWKHMYDQALFIKEHAGRQTCPTPTPLNARINSAVPELYPSMAVDTSVMYFTRRVLDQNDDFFTVQKDTCSEWYNVTNIGYPANTPHQELAQCISADGHYLFITRCDVRSEDGWQEGGCDMFMAYRVSNTSDWTIPQPFGFTINTPSFEGMPSVSADTRDLYFASDRKGGYGGYDIYISSFNNGVWQPPVNAGPSINTAGNETAPYINLDNKTLFFTSDGHPGYGGTDIFMSRRKNDTSWLPAENMGTPINTPHDEKSTCVALDGQKMYFSSDRNGPAGNYDIFEARMPFDMRPAPVSYVAGCVYDSITKQKLTSATIYVCNASRGDTLYEFKSNRGDASFLITLPLGYTYIMHTAYTEHLPIHDTIVFNKQYTQDPLIHDIVMLPYNWEEIRTIADTLIATVHFDVNVTELSPIDKKILQDALSPWLQHKNYIITVNAYTDNTGSPMLNEELSTRRANIVAKELTEMGMEGIGVLAKGWGEAMTIATNDTEEGRRTNRRVEIRIRR